MDIEPVGAIDRLDVFLSSGDLFELSSEQIAEARVDYISQSVSHHYCHNRSYRNYCEARSFDPCSVKTEEDLTSVPLLPSSVFKRKEIDLRTRYGSADENVADTTSSGTQGTISIVPRDNDTLMRFFASIAVGSHELLGMESFSFPVLNLGTPLEESEHLWVAYALAGAAVFFDSQDYVAGGELLLDSLASELVSFKGKRCAIVGPPAAIILAAESISEPVGLGSDSLVLTVGGWKKSAGDAVDRESFVETVSRGFGLPPSRIRDAFNMVEMNTCIFECVSGRKHIPPWLFARARLPRNLTVCGSGESGILSYLDPTARSFPSFILSDDFGLVEHDTLCQCGVRSDLLSIERRISRIESRGCALKMKVAL